jgi:hypothetical protein
MRVIVANGAKMKSRAACIDCQYIVQGNNSRMILGY